MPLCEIKALAYVLALNAAEEAGGVTLIDWLGRKAYVNGTFRNGHKV
jgi:hypothetical protein